MRLLILLALGAVLSSTASSDLPSVQPQHENDVKLHSLLSIINAVRKLERELDENQRQIGNNLEAQNEKLRLEKNLEEFGDVVNEHFIKIEPHQQDEIVNVLRNIQVWFYTKILICLYFWVMEYGQLIGLTKVVFV